MLNRILGILQAEARLIEQDSDYNKGVHDTLLHIIKIIESHIEE